MCHDWHLAEDLTQHTLTKLYVVWGRNGPPDTPLAYAQRILIHAVLDHRRLRSSTEIAIGDLPDEVSFRPGDLRLTVVEAIRQLSPSDRVVVVLRYWEDLGVEQTADLLGPSQAAVKARSALACCGDYGPCRARTTTRRAVLRWPASRATFGDPRPDGPGSPGSPCTSGRLSGRRGRHRRPASAVGLRVRESAGLEPLERRPAERPHSRRRPVDAGDRGAAGLPCGRAAHRLKRPRARPTGRCRRGDTDCERRPVLHRCSRTPRLQAGRSSWPRRRAVRRLLPARRQTRREHVPVHPDAVLTILSGRRAGARRSTVAEVNARLGEHALFRLAMDGGQVIRLTEIRTS